MERKDRIDALGGTVLVTFSLLMGLNQVMIKLVNAGFQFFTSLSIVNNLLGHNGLSSWIQYYLVNQTIAMMSSSFMT